MIDTDVTLRPATGADAGAIAEIWRLGWRDGHLGLVPQALVDARTDASFLERAAERVADTTVAIVRDVVAGFVMIAGDEVEQVYVASEHRGSRVARVLIEAAEQLVAAGGHRRAWLAVATGNARARRFYERSGWTADGSLDYPAATQSGPIAVACVRYAKPLRAHEIDD